jgi:hypothetical protein
VRASNSWVVGGERSRSGKPVLANDMHLSLEAPNIWFLVGLHAPGVDVVGMSIPGAPGVVAGHSRAVAWGFTNAYVDDSDFFLEQVNPDDPDQYLTPEGWAPFETREEIIRVRGGDPVTMTVRSTRHGPVITPVEGRAGVPAEERPGTPPHGAGDGGPDRHGAGDPGSDGAGDQVLAFQWVAHYPAGTFQALLGMAEARSADEFIEALRDFDNPHQNVVFADTAGAWGYWMGGRVPLRASGSPPHLPVPGWTGEHDWVGWVPFEEKPHILAPDRGYVATANNAQGRDDRAKRVSDGNWAPPYRAQRISELLEAQDLHDAQSLLAIQMDPGSAFVDRQLPHAVEAFRAAGLEELALRLEGWDRMAGPESTEATLFHTWWRTLHLRFRDHYYGGERGYFPDAVLDMALRGRAGTAPGTPGGGGAGGGGVRRSSLGRGPEPHPGPPSILRPRGRKAHALWAIRHPQGRGALLGEREPPQRSPAPLPLRIRPQPTARGGHGGSRRLRRVHPPGRPVRLSGQPPLLRPVGAVDGGAPLAPPQGTLPRGSPDGGHAAAGAGVRLRGRNGSFANQNLSTTKSKMSYTRENQLACRSWVVMAMETSLEGMYIRMLR